MRDTNFLSNPRRYMKTPRSTDEAFNTPDYAQAIWQYETDAQRSWRYLKDFAVVGALLAIAGGALYGLITFIEWSK